MLGRPAFSELRTANSIETTVLIAVSVLLAPCRNCKLRQLHSDRENTAILSPCQSSNYLTPSRLPRLLFSPSGDSAGSAGRYETLRSSDVSEVE